MPKRVKIDLTFESLNERKTAAMFVDDAPTLEASSVMSISKRTWDLLDQPEHIEATLMAKETE